MPGASTIDRFTSWCWPNQSTRKCRQLDVIVDEASLVGTLALDELVTAAREARAKVVLVGDQAQLSAFDAGGMFAALVRDRGGRAAELTDVRRFVNHWEKTASVELRAGSPDAIDAYESHGRVAGGVATRCSTPYTTLEARRRSGQDA